MRKDGLRLEPLGDRWYGQRSAMRPLVVHRAGPAADVVGREAELDAMAAALASGAFPRAS